LQGVSVNGARRIRTADLLGAIQALCQLSYSPEMVDLQGEPAIGSVVSGAECSGEARGYTSMYVGYAPLEQSEWRSTSRTGDGDRMLVIGVSGFRLASRAGRANFVAARNGRGAARRPPARHRTDRPSEHPNPSSTSRWANSALGRSGRRTAFLRLAVLVTDRPPLRTSHSSVVAMTDRSVPTRLQSLSMRGGVAWGSTPRAIWALMPWRASPLNLATQNLPPWWR
jgi:hypothetical protein